MCNCNGEITYSTELFDGYVYTVPEVERAYKVQSTGMWKCGTDQNGNKFKAWKSRVGLKIAGVEGRLHVEICSDSAQGT